jgi:integrase
MSIFKRGRVYWYHFLFNGEHVQESTKQGNPRVARQMEAAHRTSLAKGEVGIRERKRVPTLTKFAEQFKDFIKVRSEAKPNTVVFYIGKLERLLDFDFLANERLDQIDESLIERFVSARRKQVAPATVNRELATLRRMLRLAYEWKLIDRVPRIRLLDGEKIRDFVLSRGLEEQYLNNAPQPLRDIVLLILETGLRIGEVLQLRLEHVRLDALPGARFGYLRVIEGKSKNARRNIPLTDRVASMLRTRMSKMASPSVFANREGQPYLVTSINHLHQEVRATMGLPRDFVIHSLRHTMLTRLGESGVDAFTIMRIAGHSSITVSQRYVHPSPEAVERAFQRLQVAGEVEGSENERQKQLPPATFSATSEERTTVTH